MHKCLGELQCISKSCCSSICDTLLGTAYRCVSPHTFTQLFKKYFRHSSLAKFPTLGDSSSFSASNMWNQTLNLKKLGSSKLKLVGCRIESRLNEPRVEFADGKDSTVSIRQELSSICTPYILKILIEHKFRLLIIHLSNTNHLRSM